MKALFTLAFFLITITSFETSSGRNAGTVIECAPEPDNTVKATAFFQEGEKVLIRKNVGTLSDEEINSIRDGVRAMKALPLSDPTSWGYQAAIHGTTANDNLQSWNMCQHRTQFFFSWHRMYLYFFERILRAKSGNPDLTLPYWDYQTKAVLPSAYRNSHYINAFGIRRPNPLYDGSRHKSVDNGGAVPGSISKSLNNSLKTVSFYKYQKSLENPHGAVHISIGGNMGNIRTAGKDPLFYLHHGNIDRLWEVWLRRCGGRANPTASDAKWWNQRYTFFDEKKRAIVMTGAQIVKTAAQLGYRYQGLSETVACAAARPEASALSLQTWNLLTVPSVERLDQNNLKVSFSRAKRDSLERFLKMTGGKYDEIAVSVEIIKINKAPEGVIEVYLNLPSNETASANSKSFIGVLDLFSASGHMHHNTSELDATDAVKALGLSPADFGNLELTLIVRGNTTADGTEASTYCDVDFGNIKISATAMEKDKETAYYGAIRILSYPNPSRGDFSLTVKSSVSDEQIQLKILNASGNIVEIKRINANSTARFGNSYPAGTYFVEARQGKEDASVKLIKQ